MSFRCEFCEQVSKPREKMRLVPVQVRSVLYSTIVGETRGTEIVKEQRCCEKCWLSGAGDMHSYEAKITETHFDNPSQMIAARVFS